MRRWIVLLLVALAVIGAATFAEAARQFNGTSQFLQSASSIDLTAYSKLTVSMWLWWDAYDVNDALAMEFGTPSFSVTNGGFLFDPNESGTSKPQFALHGDVGTNSGTFDRTSMTTGAWHHVVITFDTAQSQGLELVNAWVDAANVNLNKTGSAENTGTFANATLVLMSRAGSSLFGAGRMAEVAIWGGITFSQTDVDALYNSGSGVDARTVQTSSLHNYWQLCGTASPEPALTGSVNMTVGASAPFVAHPISGSGICAGGGDVTPPTDPSGLTVTALTSDAIFGSWTASTDNVGVTAYLVERCAGAACSNFVQVSTPTATSGTDGGLAANTLYRYRVRAQDAAGNLSGYSNIAQATTLATQARTLSWTPTAPLTQDGFNIYRCVTSSASCTPTATVYATASSTATTTTDNTSGNPTSCYQVQATLAGTSGSGLSNIACSAFTASLTITNAGTGTGSTIPSGTTNYASGTVVNLTAIPAPTADFGGWSGDADCADASVTMNTNVNCTATFNLQQGTFAYLGSRGSNISKTSGTTVSVTPTATASQTNLLIVRATTDNAGTTSGQTSDHKSVTDTLGNQYTKLSEQTRSGGSAGTGVTTSLWASRPFASVTTNNSVTLTTGTAVVAKAITLEEFMLAANTTFSTTTSTNTGTNGNSTTPSAVISGASSVLRLFLGLLGIEGPNTDSYTQSVNYASGTATNGTTGGASTTNVAARFGFRRQTATGDTFAPTISPAENWALVYSSLATAPAVNSASLTLTNSGTGGGTLIGAGTFYQGTTVQIQAIPDASSQFGGWTTISGNDCTSPSNTIVNFGLSTNTTCNAVFTLATPPPPQNYTLTINTTGTGGGTTTGAGVYASGTVVNMTATPNSQSTFDGWSPAVCSSGTVTMTADTTCTASFTLLPLATMTTVNTGTGLGTTTGAGTYFQGQTAVLTATPNQGSVFAGWSGSSGCTGTTSPLSVLMDTSKTCTATYNVSGPGPVGLITASPFKRCTVSYTAALTSGGPIATVQWKIDGVNTKSSTPGVPMLQTTAPFLFTHSLVLNGALVSADVTDTGGQTSTFGPVQVSCP